MLSVYSLYRRINVEENKLTKLMSVIINEKKSLLMNKLKDKIVNYGAIA